MRVEPGDALLYAVSSRRSLPWDSLKQSVDAIHASARLVHDIRFLRSEAARIGDALGHWDWAVIAGSLRVAAAPPVLARLPWPGMPRAVVCGSRSPDTVAELRALRGGGGVEVRAVSQVSAHPFAPTRIELTEISDGALPRFAEALHLELPEEPPAWSLAESAASLDDYLQTLTWASDDGLDWPRRDFDPVSLRIGPPRPDEDDELMLSLYEHPQGWTSEVRLRRGDAFASCDRAWGRFAVLSALQRNVVEYSHKEGILRVPVGVPLPRLLHRALTLCSGSITAGSATHRTYGAVPIGIQSSVLEKLRQSPKP